MSSPAVMSVIILCCIYNNAHRMEAIFDEYMHYANRMSSNVNFDTELVSAVITKLHRDEAPDIDGLTI